MSETNGGKKLNHKERLFVDAVAKGVGYEQAAIKAGYSAKSAHVLANRLLKKDKINEALQKRREYFRTIADVEAKDIIGAQAEIAFGSIEDALDESGRLDYPKAVQNGSAKLIKKISRQQTRYGETVAVEFYSRTDALGQLTDILGLKQQPRNNDADNLSIAKKVVAGLLAEGKTQDEAVKYASSRYGVLEADLVGA